MKSVNRIVFVVLTALLLGCQQQSAFTETEKEAMRKEVTDQFTQLFAAINQKDARVWSEFYSKDGFLSAIVGTEYYGERSAWVNLITQYFSMRERQQAEPLEVRVTPLTPDLALLTSEEKSEMWFKAGNHVQSKHVFTMLWKKGQDGWKILHSHESWVEEQAK